MKGWIKIHRSFKDWEWYDDPKMVALFIHLLLSANFEDNKWHGITIKRGQFVTSLNKLSEESGISVRSIRTCLARLKETQEITEQVTNKYRIITICKWYIYQGNNLSDDKQATSKRQTTDNQTTTNKEYKNIEEYNSSSSIRAKLEKETINNSLWLDRTMMMLRSDRVLEIAVQAMDEWELKNIDESRWDAEHLINYIRKHLQIQKNNQRMDKQEAKETRRAELKRKILSDLNINGYAVHQQQTERDSRGA